jgi:hypothetical protein
MAFKTGPQYARVYRQLEPIAVETRDNVLWHQSQFELVGGVAGTQAECWELARHMCKSPVLEFERKTRDQIEVEQGEKKWH